MTFTPLLVGNAAMRNTKRGSWYIEALTQVFSERACDMHVADMLVKVSQFQLAPQAFASPSWCSSFLPCTLFSSTLLVGLYMEAQSDLRLSTIGSAFPGECPYQGA